MGGFCRFLVTRKCLELLICCFDGQIIQHGQILRFRDKEVGAMVLVDELGIQETSNGPFKNIKPIKPIEPKNTQGREMLCRLFSIYLPSPRWILHPRNQKLQYLVLEWSVVCLMIASKPPHQIFVSRSGLPCCFGSTLSETLAFPEILRKDRIRSFWNVSIGVGDQRSFFGAHFFF